MGRGQLIFWGGIFLIFPLDLQVQKVTVGNKMGRTGSLGYGKAHFILYGRDARILDTLAVLESADGAC
jgi:hypothetical protein